MPNARAEDAADAERVAVTTAVSTTGTTTATGTTTRRARIVLFGDSLTQRAFEAPNGWGASLANAFARSADTFNRGYGGYNSRWCARIARSVMGELMDAYGETLLVTVMLGTNDATTMRDAEAQTRNRAHVPVEEYRENLRGIVGAALDVSMYVVVMTPPVVDHEQRAKTQRDRYGEAWDGSVWEDERLSIGEYAQAARDVAQELSPQCTNEIGKRVVLVDVYEATKEAKRRGEDIFSDGVHFNAAGQSLVFITLMDHLRKMRFVQLMNNAPDYPYGHEVRNSTLEDAIIFSRHEELRRVTADTFRDAFRVVATLDR